MTEKETKYNKNLMVGSQSLLPRTEKFYGRRKGPSLSARQQSLIDTVLPRYSIDVAEVLDGTLDPQSLFPSQPKEIWFEIGFGKGEHLAWQAERNPDVGFIGCEPYLNGVVGLLDTIDSKGIENIRIYGDDARHILGKMPDSSVSRLFLLHPDPWPKRRHAKRRFVNNGNLDEISRVLKPGGEFRVGTDDPTYREWTAIVMSERTDFEWTAESQEDWMVRPDDWPETRYNVKTANEGRPAVYFKFRRN